ncbi:hypothetical protein NQ317_000814 [Molorchus minor]|uniref:Endonuclease/exonuclease/phosphatase domain-containing protein n=1 Tax=Molorchus minor TaxID=1323400 RepID=A0ABQ9IWU7_9CUCU|nr:hypothetical protein NQ317_000814 [Molorchus minor]
MACPIKLFALADFGTINLGAIIAVSRGGCCTTVVGFSPHKSSLFTSGQPRTKIFSFACALNALLEQTVPFTLIFTYALIFRHFHIFNLFINLPRGVILKLSNDTYDSPDRARSVGIDGSESLELPQIRGTRDPEPQRRPAAGQDLDFTLYSLRQTQKINRRQPGEDNGKQDGRRTIQRQRAPVQSRDAARTAPRRQTTKPKAPRNNRGTKTDDDPGEATRAKDQEMAFLQQEITQMRADAAAKPKSPAEELAAARNSAPAEKLATAEFSAVQRRGPKEGRRQTRARRGLFRRTCSGSSRRSLKRLKAALFARGEGRKTAKRSKLDNPTSSSESEPSKRWKSNPPQAGPATTQPAPTAQLAPAPPPKDRAPPVILRSKDHWTWLSRTLREKKVALHPGQADRGWDQNPPNHLPGLQATNQDPDGRKSRLPYLHPARGQTTRVVIRGLPEDLSETEILEDLQDQGYAPTSAQRMRSRRTKNRMPMVLSTAPGNTDVCDDGSTVREAPVDSIRILSWNADGIRSRRNELLETADRLEPDVIAIQETKMDSRHEFKMRGYKVYRQDRNIRGGGVAVLVKSNITHHQTRAGGLGNLESIGVEIQLPRREPLHILSCYQPPNAPLLGEDLGDLFPDAQQVIAIEDFNAKSRQWNSRRLNARGRELEGFLDAHPEIRPIAPPEPTQQTANNPPGRAGHRTGRQHTL